MKKILEIHGGESLLLFNNEYGFLRIRRVDGDSSALSQILIPEDCLHDFSDTIEEFLLETLKKKKGEST